MGGGGESSRKSRHGSPPGELRRSAETRAPGEVGAGSARGPGEVRGHRQALLRFRAERLLRRDFAGLRSHVNATVRGRLRSHGVQIDAHDLEACYAQAWHGLYGMVLRGQRIDDPAAWLTVVTYRRALDELEQRIRQDAARDAQAQVALAGATMPSSGADIPSTLDNRTRLRELLEGLNARLSPRERLAATLCYLHGLTRAEAARHMGVSEARMRKLMEGTREKPGVAARLKDLQDAIGAGEWCEQQGSLMRAYALGVLDPDGERYAQARGHLRECPACRLLVLTLRGLASALPPLALPSPLSVDRPGGAAGRRGSAADRSRSRAARLRSRMRLRPAHTGLLPKLALAGTSLLGVGGGHALLAGQSPGHAARPAAISLAPRALGTVAESAVSRTPHGPKRSGRRTAARLGRGRPAKPVLRAGVSPARTSGAQSGFPEARSPAQPPTERAPAGEFTPERLPAGR